jgi:hypothetical protein
MMSRNPNHIISKFQWNTLFDKKEKGSELQERLSHWSRINMPKEVTEVFDKVCPPEQTWRIQTLEIDLGLIDYNDLEFELSARLRTQLCEKLIDLIIYANRGGNNLEILNEDTSHIYLISSFLLNGIMPWTYKYEDGSVNQMLAGQLQNNRQNVIDMISTVGVTHENVRKRIAWQISEANIIKIIEGIEPNNHTQIIDFSNELIKIQAKETIVQSSARDFRKQLWLWILNYLLTERGSIFNKISYMKSTIRQMASHYNIGYAELIALIERAVIAVGKAYGIKADFLTTINIIVNENASLYATSELRTEHTIDFGDKLLTYFKDSTSRKSNLQKIEFNELIIGLYRQNKLKFKDLILSLGYTEKLWLNAINYLNRASIDVIFSALSASNAFELLESIDFLSKALNKLNLNVERKTLYNTSLRFLFNHKNSSVDVEAFLSYHVSEVSKIKKLSNSQLLDKLTDAKPLRATKTASLLNIYNSLTEIYIAELSNMDSAGLEVRFGELLDLLINYLGASHTYNEDFLSAHKTLLKNVGLYPKIAVEALIRYPDKAKLQPLLPYILDDHTTQLLTAELKKTNPVFKLLQVIIQEVKANAAYSKLAIDEVLMPIALQAIILKRGSASTIFEQIIVKFYRQLTIVESVLLGKLLDRLVEEKRLPYFKSAGDAEIEQSQSVTYKINHIISSSTDEAEELCRLIAENFNSVEIAQIKQYKAQLNSDILNYIIPNGERLLTLLIKEYTAIISGITEQQIISRLTELYWICLCNYSDHRGQATRLSASFRVAVLHHFKLSGISKQDNSINYLPQGKQLMDTLIKEYFSIIKSTKSGVKDAEILHRLSNLYKKCLADYNNHRGKSGALIVLFRKFVLFEFEISDELLLPENTKLYRSIATELKQVSDDLLIGHENSFYSLDKDLLAQLNVPNSIAPILKVYHLRNGLKIPDYELFIQIEKALINESGIIKTGKTKIKLTELLCLALNQNSSQLREIISYTPISQKRVDLLNAAISFNQFCLCMAVGARSAIVSALESIRLLYDIAILCTPGQVDNQLLNQYWHQAWKIITTGSFSEGELKALVRHSFYLLTQQADNDTESIMLVLKRNNIRLTAALKAAIVDCMPNFANTPETATEPQADLLLAEQKGLLCELNYALIIQKQIPFWYPGKGSLSAKELLNEMIKHYPANVLQVLKQEIVPQQQMQWLSQAANFSQLIESIIHLNRSRQSLLNTIEQFYKVLGHVSINGISSTELQYVLFKKIIRAWGSDNWRIISVENIWNELIWEVCTQRGVTQKDFISGIEKSQIALPPSLHISFTQLKDQYQAIINAPVKLELIKPLKKMLKKQDTSTSIKGGIPVRNAGMVLIASYIPILFERLGLTRDKKFLDTSAQSNAVHYLQYVVSGLGSTEESLLPLNKVLCGLPLSYPVPDGITITGEQVNLIQGLIQAVIGYWPAIGSTSIAGLRGNWLVRDGLLVELDERWELTVEKRAYDLLIHKSPFSFSIIKYPWMDKPLHVQWPY